MRDGRVEEKRMGKWDRFPPHAHAPVELLTAEPRASMTLGLLVISKRP